MSVTNLQGFTHTVAMEVWRSGLNGRSVAEIVKATNLPEYRVILALNFLREAEGYHECVYGTSEPSIWVTAANYGYLKFVKGVAA